LQTREVALYNCFVAREPYKVRCIKLSLSEICLHGSYQRGQITHRLSTENVSELHGVTYSEGEKCAVSWA